MQGQSRGKGQLQVVQERKDPNVAPRGCAFTPEAAEQLMLALEKGIHTIMGQFNVKAYSMVMVTPLVEWRKDIPLPGGGSKDDFVILRGRPHYLGGPFSPSAELVKMLKDTAPLVWNDAYSPKAAEPLTAVASEGVAGETPVVPAEPSTDGPGNIIPMAGTPESQPPQETPPA